MLCILEMNIKSCHIRKPNLYCRPCGGLVTYVDDSPYTLVVRDPGTLSSKLSDKYKAIENYMVKNKMAINADKTYLVVMGSKAVTRVRQALSMRAAEFMIHPSETIFARISNGNSTYRQGKTH